MDIMFVLSCCPMPKFVTVPGQGTRLLRQYGAVMDAWAADQKIEGSMLTFLADPRSEVTQELGMILDHPGPISKLGYNRSKRFAMYIEDGIIKVWKVSRARRSAGTTTRAAPLQSRWVQPSTRSAK